MLFHFYVRLFLLHAAVWHRSAAELFEATRDGLQYIIYTWNTFKRFLHVISGVIQARVRGLRRLEWYSHAFRSAVFLFWGPLPHHGSQQAICSRLRQQEELNKLNFLKLCEMKVFLYSHSRFYKVHSYYHRYCKIFFKTILYVVS